MDQRYESIRAVADGDAVLLEGGDWVSVGLPPDGGALLTND
jgi:hypothetical protein